MYAMKQTERENIPFKFTGYQSEETYKCTSCSGYRPQDSFTSLSLSFFSILRSPLHGDCLLLYSLLNLIRTLHLLTIWTSTWVPVPSDIHLIFLWVALANVTLFACLLHINAAEKVASSHLMRQLWLLPGRLTLSSFLLCVAHPTTHVCLGWFFTVAGGAHWAHICVSEETFLLGRLLRQTGLYRIGPWALPLGRGWAPCGVQGPLLTLGILPPHL